MKTHRIFVVVGLAGVLLFTSVQRVNAMDPYYQDLLSNMLSGLVSGTPYGSYGGPYGAPPYGPYGNPSNGSSYGTPPYSPYGNSPSYDPYGLSRGGYYRPERGSSGPYPYDPYWDRDNRDRYQERMGNLNEKYDKAMRRLDRQQYEASVKARQKYRDPSRYSEQMAKIDRKYNYKRYKVERNTATDYRKLSGRY